MLIMELTYYLVKIIGILMFCSFLFYPTKPERPFKRAIIFLIIYLVLSFSHYIYFNPNINNNIHVFVYDERKETGDIGSYDEYYHLDKKCPNMKEENYKLIFSGEINDNSNINECPTCFNIFLDKSTN